MKIRIAQLADLEQIVAIYNQAILRSYATADQKLFAPEEKADWFKAHQPQKYPIFVAEENSQIIGWNSLSPYRGSREALIHTLETSYYIHNQHHRKGIASRLLEHVVKVAPDFQVHNLLAFVMVHNQPSINLLTKFGFSVWGTLPEVANFDGNLYDHLIFGKKLR